MSSDIVQVSVTQTHLRRRNGRKQACEPCRRRKVACDHGVPVCQRCRRRKTSEDCVYIVQGPDAATPIRPRSGHATAVEACPRPCPRPTPSSTASEARRADSVSDTGYLGPTSFSAVLQETQDNLNGQGTPALCGQTPRATPRPRLPTTPCERLSPQAVEVLEAIPERRSSMILFKQHINPNDGWCRLAAEMLIESLWATFGPHLEPSRGLSGFTVVAEILSTNSQTHLNEDLRDPDEWFQSFSGDNYRWECLGILFTYWAFGSLSMIIPNHIVSTNQQKRALFRKYKEGAWKCAELSRDARASNTLLVYLLYKHSLLESIDTGDYTLQYWRLHADVIATATYLGLHTVQHSPSTTPSVSYEIKKRLFGQIFNIDKVAATFTGRPSLLNWRYCSTALPLDIDDWRLLGKSPPDGIEGREIDVHGWNQDAKIYSTTILRARTMLNFIRDPILEIALGNPTTCSRETLLNLKQKQLDASLQFPQITVYSPDDHTNPDVDAPTLYAKILIRLEQLQNLFFIERLLKRIDPNGSSELLGISIETLTLTLLFWTHRDQLAGLQSDYEWLVMSYAAPAGGIICTELLTPSHSAASPRPKRSEMIQKLSLLIGFLDWVQPTAPNSDLCYKVKTIMNHVLEEALEFKEAVPGGPNFLEEDFWDPSLDPNEFFNFDLLDTFDWLRPSDDPDS